ncbi:Recombination protein RecR [Trichinella spiralis]|uniref:Recombination protein RecR n=1 Tax=Trichinella spiralis TaxID=6334 RepID=A0ABR3KM36_TRISP
MKVAKENFKSLFCNALGNGVDLVGVTHSRISVCKAWSGQEYCGPTEACSEDHYRDNPTTVVGVEEAPCCVKDQLVVRRTKAYCTNNRNGALSDDLEEWREENSKGRQLPDRSSDLDLDSAHFPTDRDVPFAVATLEGQKRVSSRTGRTEEKKKAKNRTFVFSVHRPLFVPYV